VEKFLIKNNPIFYTSHLEGGGTTYGINSLKHPKISPYINPGNILEMCSGPGFMGFYLNFINKCKTLTLIDINNECKECIDKTIEYNNINNTNFYQSNGFTNIKLNLKFDTIILNPPHHKKLSNYTFASKSITVDSENLDFHHNFFNNVSNYMDRNSNIIYIGASNGNNNISPSDILNITKNKFNIKLINFDYYGNNKLHYIHKDGKYELSEFYVMVLSLK
jgi:methylase of polypeptide subunit release factors